MAEHVRAPRPSEPSFDVAIVGAGCAGLSLAWRLPADARVALIDPRDAYARDRTWCSWSVAPTDFDDLCDRRWTRWRVRASGRPWVERRAPALTYRRLPADRFYERTLARVEERGFDRIRARALDVRTEGDRAVVDTDAGPITARVAFDSRPVPVTGSAREPVALLQSFLGWEVALDHDAFDPDVATLMDFAHPPRPEHGVAFTYVLPDAPRRALVEVTWFAPTVPSRADMARHLEDYLSSLGVRTWRTTFEERGVIPMTAAPFDARPSPRVHRIGLAGGAAKPSTGYAFVAIQRQCEALARALEGGASFDAVAPRTAFALTQDRAVLRYLASDGAAASRALVGLFERVEPDALARFLSETASPRDHLRVMRAMPPAAMLRALSGG